MTGLLLLECVFLMIELKHVWGRVAWGSFIREIFITFLFNRNTSPVDFISGVRVLVSLLGNVVAHPSESKYRTLKSSNPSLQSRLLVFPGGVQALGFVRVHVMRG